MSSYIYFSSGQTDKYWVNFHHTAPRGWRVQYVPCLRLVELVINKIQPKSYSESFSFLDTLHLLIVITIFFWHHALCSCALFLCALFLCLHLYLHCLQCMSLFCILSVFLFYFFYIRDIRVVIIIIRPFIQVCASQNLWFYLFLNFFLQFIP